MLANLNRYVISTLVLCVITLFPAGSAFAQDKSHGGFMDHSGHMGEKIHESEEKGYGLAYHLLDLPDREEIGRASCRERVCHRV